MMWIDLQHKKPTDAGIPGWTPWSQDAWQAWLGESARLTLELAALQAAGDIEGRNDLIEANGGHWGKLKSWLEALSHGKCWFSEAGNDFSHYDVEHFRPKSVAKEFDGTLRDGYWWLAFDYMNYRLCGNVGNRKKGVWFPLQEGCLRSSYERPTEESEECYFLDPIKRGDVDLLAFDEEGKAVPAPGASPWDCLRVEETVKRLKLNEHEMLAEARRKVWSKMTALINEYETARARCRVGGNPAARQRLTDILLQMDEMTSRSSELSSVARWCVHLRNEPRLSKLVA